MSENTQKIDETTEQDDDKGSDTVKIEEKLQKYKEEAEKAKGDLNNVVGELKELRQQKRDLEDRLEDDGGSKSDEDDLDDVESKIQSVLKRERKEQRKRNREKALERFYSENKEFHPDNDSSGLKRSALERELENFNLDSAHDQDDFITYLNKAKRLVSESDNKSKSESVDIPASSSDSTSPPSSGSNHGLSNKEKKLIRDAGWTEERYVKIKKSQPSYIRGLLNNI